MLTALSVSYNKNFYLLGLPCYSIFDYDALYVVYYRTLVSPSMTCFIITMAALTTPYWNFDNSLTK